MLTLTLVTHPPQLTPVHVDVSSGLEDVVLSVRNGIPPPPRRWHGLQEGEDTWSECRSAVCMWCLLSPHLSADKVSDKAVQGTPCRDRTIPVLVGEVIWLRLITNTKRVWEVDSGHIKLGCNIRYVVLGIIICAKCAAVWEGCVWSCASSCWENVPDAHHPHVTAGSGVGLEKERKPPELDATQNQNTQVMCNKGVLHN